MKRKAILAIAMAVCMSGSMVGCGNSSPRNEKELESKLDNMTEEDFEKAAESIDAADSANAGAETATEETIPEIVYEPSDEILNADFSSGLVQIGNDIFRNGGYYTVDQFVAEYGDRYDMSELNPDSLTNARTSKGVTIVSLADPSLKINVYYDNSNVEGDKVRLGDAAVIIIRSDFGVDNCWYPKGVRVNGDDYDYSNIPSFIESNGYKKVTQSEVGNEYYMNYKMYWEEDSSSEFGNFKFRERGTEINLFGHYPVYNYCFTYRMDDTKAFMFVIDTGISSLYELTPIS